LILTAWSLSLLGVVRILPRGLLAAEAGTLARSIPSAIPTRLSLLLLLVLILILARRLPATVGRRVGLRLAQLSRVGLLFSWRIWL
jgi:hypothetical protein